MDGLLNKVNSPADLKTLSCEQLKQYAEEVRTFIMDTVSTSGGHLASNLGAVELSIALHYVFDSPTDKILWDVGHQAYTHKIITGRREAFGKLRENGGISGFPRMTENEHDAFTMGHSSTSLSVGLGYVRARDLRGEDYSVVSIIGDGAFTGGMAFEALNDIGATRAKMIIILNDNTMSISKNVGALSNHLAKLRLSKRYSHIKYNIKKGAQALPFFGDKIFKALDRTKDSVKSLLQANKMFESLGIKYYGPFDGHNLNNLINIFRQVKSENKPVLIHLITKKGKGDYEAEQNPAKYHGVSPQCNDSDGALEKEKPFSDVLGAFLCDAAKKNANIVAVSAAMLDGTGLRAFKQEFPHRCYDVGIAEQHAVTLCAGLAAGGCKPYFSVYSTFLQRAYDQILHDVCINDLPVTFTVDRAGVVGADGLTHQGVFDIGYLSMLPNMTVCTPKDGEELRRLLEWSLTYNHPLAIRYPKSYRTEYKSHQTIALGQWEQVQAADSPVTILAAGNRMLNIALTVRGVNVYSATFLKPLDGKLLDTLNRAGNLLITMEDNVASGGFGEAVTAYCERKEGAEVAVMALPDQFIDNFDVEDSLRQGGISTATLLKIIEKFEKKQA